MKGHSERNEINNNAIQMGNTPYDFLITLHLISDI